MTPLDTKHLCNYTQAVYGTLPVCGNGTIWQPPSISDNVIGYCPSSLDGYTVPTLEIGACNVWTWDNDVSQFFPSHDAGFTQPSHVYAESVLKEGDLDTPRPSLRYRVVASAFEVTNTTSQLNRQGTATLVRQSCSQDIEYNLVSTDTAILSESFDQTTSFPLLGLRNYTYTNIQLPPRDLSSAMLAGGVQWDAAEGGYSVSVYDYENCNLVDSIPTQVSMRTGRFDGAPLELPNSIATIAQTDITIGSQKQMVNKKDARQTAHFSPRDVVAHYYTGLSPSTTLNLSTRYYVEMAPREQDTEYTNLVALRKPSPLCDEHALWLYQRAASKLLPGVPVHMNSIGDFFKSVWSTIKSVASPLIRTALPVAGPLLLKAAPIIGGALMNHLQKKRQQSAAATATPVRKAGKPKKKLRPKARTMQLDSRQVVRGGKKG